MTAAYRPGQLYTSAHGDRLFTVLTERGIGFVTNRGTQVTVEHVEEVYAPLRLVRDVGQPVPAQHGPFETSDQAVAAAREVYEAMRLGPPGTMRRANLDRLTDAIVAAGVELGAYDRQIVKWLAGWEPETVAVIAGLVLRANGGAR
ncbi:hypothetical protein ACFY4C_20320 [Actinomadura viridis]|uniref:hypothetical protein n=1 Tax=Actinomadura viridis TaxID=58110 RepID=UPI0036A17827